MLALDALSPLQVRAPSQVLRRHRRRVRSEQFPRRLLVVNACRILVREAVRLLSCQRELDGYVVFLCRLGLLVLQRDMTRSIAPRGGSRTPMPARSRIPGLELAVDHVWVLIEDELLPEVQTALLVVLSWRHLALILPTPWRFFMLLLLVWVWRRLR